MLPRRSLKWLGVAVAGSLLSASAHAEDLSGLSKGHRLLIQNGLQVVGLVDTGNIFNANTYQNANYTSVFWWLAGSNPSAAPNLPWSRAVSDPSTMPGLTPSEQGEYMKNLVALQLGDEQYLNDRNPGGNFDQAVQWFQSAENDPAYANTLLYLNSWGSELSDQTLSDFITTARPDMISFDTYPWVQGQDPPGGSPNDWYTWLNRYRSYATSNNIPFGIYRQLYHSTGDGRRDPSPSEQNLNTMGALAFGATYLADFTYNTGASSMFDRYPNDPTHGAGDSLPNAIYQREAVLNAQARNLGKALVRLTPVADHGGETFPGQGAYAPGAHTTSMMIIRGKHMDSSNNLVFNDLPSGFVQDPNAPTRINATTNQTEPDPTKVGYTDWVTKVNDPYLNGGFTLTGPTNFGVRNLDTKNNGLPGDVIISWFKLLDESFDGPNFNDERYFMVVNGLTGPDGTAADYRQEIILDYLFPTGSGINSLQRLDENTGQVINVPLTSLGNNKWRLTLDLDGGEAALFKFNDGAPFVGTPEPTSLSMLGMAAIALFRRRTRSNVKRASQLQNVPLAACPPVF